MYLLDTDTCTHLLIEQPRVVRNATEVATRGDVIGITVIARIEVLRGRFDALLKADERSKFLTMQRRLIRTEEALQRIRVVLLDDAALDRFERLNAIRGLKKIGRADLLIASILLAQDATLVTRNVRHFGRVPQLKYVNWVD